MEIKNTPYIIPKDLVQDIADAVKGDEALEPVIQVEADTGNHVARAYLEAIKTKNSKPQEPIATKDAPQ